MKVCTKCGEEKELSLFNKNKNSNDGFKHWCRDCSHIAAKIYRDNNREEENNRTRIWKSKNRDRLLEKNRKIYQYRIKTIKNYYSKIKINRHIYYIENKEKILINQKRYRLTNEGRINNLNNAHKKRQRKILTSDGSIPIDIEMPINKNLMALRDKQENKCAYCGCELDYETPRAVHLDHIIPMSKGGTHTLKNVVWSCASCNLRKASSIIITHQVI